MAQRSNQVATRDDNPDGPSTVAVIDPGILAMFAEQASAIPAMEDKGMDDILLQIFNATTWQEVDKPWKTSKVDDIIGKPLRVNSVRRLPSRYTDGLGIFLVIKMTDPRDGKEYVKATGAIAVVGQFVRLFYLRATAITIVWCQAKYPTDDGYYPQHLEIVDAHIPDQADAETASAS